MSKTSGYANTDPKSKLFETASLAPGRLVLEYPEEGELRSRTVVSRSRARSTGKYPSWKMGRMIQCESLNELKLARVLDADPEIAAFNEQPLTIYYSLNGAAHRHYPDFKVEWRNGVRELWEVKPASKAAHPEVLKRTRYLEQVLPDVGFTYRLVVVEDAIVEPRLQNARTLLRFGRNPIDVVTREKIRQILRTSSYVSWGSARNGNLGPHGRNALARLALEGVLTFDRTAKISDSSQFILATQEKKAA